MKILFFLCLCKFLEASIVKDVIESESLLSQINSTKLKQNYVLIINNSFEFESNLDRKRSHKRRRKIRKPVRGLR